MLSSRPATLLLTSIFLIAEAGCPTPKAPTGPPPEYEEPTVGSAVHASGADAGSDPAPSSLSPAP